MATSISASPCYSTTTRTWIRTLSGAAMTTMMAVMAMVSIWISVIGTVTVTVAVTAVGVYAGVAMQSGLRGKAL